MGDVLSHIEHAELREVLRLAARWHDLGKHRKRWQQNLRNHEYPAKVIAKTGHRKPPLQKIGYRHEFGSLLDLAELPEFKSLSDEHKELLLHLVAAHHGRARPHFTADEAFDAERTVEHAAEMAEATPGRFARLQRRHGRWGLAWLESLLRAADISASIHPTPTEDKR